MGQALGAATNFVTGVLSIGTHLFAVVVNDKSNNKAAQSGTAAVAVPPAAPLAPPNPATGLTAVLNP